MKFCIVACVLVVAVAAAPAGEESAGKQILKF